MDTTLHIEFAWAFLGHVLLSDDIVVCLPIIADIASKDPLGLYNIFNLFIYLTTNSVENGLTLLTLQTRFVISSQECY
eukprot:m.39553 g.39553  ORF g.39553 m.39553 type:complete len:78 (-) comp6871_c0_seq1:55-288(-)